MPHLAALHVYPIKSCRGMALEEVRLGPRGFEFDREWMLVDASGRFVTQRQLPRLAMISTALTAAHLVVEAPQHGRREIPREPLRAVDPTAPRPVQIWKDTCLGLDEGDEVADWFSSFLGQSLRLVRFAPDQRRLSNRAWTGDLEAENAFSDGYPILVISEASLADLNQRLGGTPLPMNRFRPNLVLGGVEPYFEDHCGTLHFADVELRIVKPCERRRITTTDQATAEVGQEPLATLATYRRDARLQGVVFGQNAVVARGVGHTLRVGQEVAL